MDIKIFKKAWIWILLAIALIVCLAFDFIKTANGKEVDLFSMHLVTPLNKPQPVNHIVLTDAKQKKSWICFQPMKKNQAIDLLKLIRINSKEVSEQKSDVNLFTYRIDLFLEKYEPTTVSVYFSENFSTVWIKENEKQSYTYSVTNSENIKKSVLTLTNENEQFYIAHAPLYNEEQNYIFLSKENINQILKNAIPAPNNLKSAQNTYSLSIQDAALQSEYLFYNNFFCKKSANKEEFYYYQTQDDQNFIDSHAKDMFSKYNNMRQKPYSGRFGNSIFKALPFTITSNELKQIQNMLSSAVPINKPKCTNLEFFYSITLPTETHSYLTYHFAQNYFKTEINGTYSYFNYSENIYRYLEQNAKITPIENEPFAQPLYPVFIKNKKNPDYQSTDYYVFDADSKDGSQIQKINDTLPNIIMNLDSDFYNILQLQFPEAKPEAISMTAFCNGSYVDYCSFNQEDYSIVMPNDYGIYDLTFHIIWSNYKKQMLSLCINNVIGSTNVFQSVNELPHEFFVVPHFDSIVSLKIDPLVIVEKWNGKKVSEPITDLQTYIDQKKEKLPVTSCHASYNINLLFYNYWPKQFYLYTLEHEKVKEISMNIHERNINQKIELDSFNEGINYYLLDCYWEDSHVQYVFAVNLNIS